jgi:UV DNA damage endonuclease
MQLGYPCSNLTLDISAARTFRLASYSEERLIETVSGNLDALETILAWNRDHDIRFFRISSGTIPFASHPVMTVDWRSLFSEQLRRIGSFIRDHAMRINVHPGQYNLLNSPRADVVERTTAELQYHADLLDLMGLDDTNKIQIHTGGVYGDRDAATRSFVVAYGNVPERIHARLVIENDERQFSLADTLRIHNATGVPLLFDTFHHTLFNHGETLAEAIDLAQATWSGHGAQMIDYSSQHTERQPGAHTISIDLDDFALVSAILRDREVDVMLEIKDKEASVLRAMAFLTGEAAAAGKVTASSLRRRPVPPERRPRSAYGR